MSRPRVGGGGEWPPLCVSSERLLEVPRTLVHTASVPFKSKCHRAAPFSKCWHLFRWLRRVCVWSYSADNDVFVYALFNRKELCRLLREGQWEGISRHLCRIVSGAAWYRGQGRPSPLQAGRTRGQVPIPSVPGVISASLGFCGEQMSVAIQLVARSQVPSLFPRPFLWLCSST